MGDKPNRSAGAVPQFIQNQLKFPPVSKSEDPEEFRSLFTDLANSIRCETSAEYTIVFQATILAFRLVGLERMRAPLIRHKEPEAVRNLLIQVHPHRPVQRVPAAEMDAHKDRLTYYGSTAGKQAVEANLAKSGYSKSAVEVESFELALPLITTLDRSIATINRQLMACLKELDRRDAKKAEALRKAAASAVLQLNDKKPEKQEMN